MGTDLDTMEGFDLQDMTRSKVEAEIGTPLHMCAGGRGCGFVRIRINATDAAVLPQL